MFDEWTCICVAVTKARFFIALHRATSVLRFRWTGVVQGCDTSGRDVPAGRHLEQMRQDAAHRRHQRLILASVHTYNCWPRNKACY